MGRFYVTTAIYYPNDTPHLGTAYEILGADAIARWRRLRGDDVFFLSGNDEHALKVAQRAQERGLEPKAYCDEMARKFEEAWRFLGVSYDEYIRTSERRHHGTVAWFLGRIREGDEGRKARKEAPVLYRGTYEGLYCVGCEAFKGEKDLRDGRCPEHPDRTPEKLREDNWFFRLSAFAPWLKDWYRANPDWLRPESKRNEMLALLGEGLQDISVSRPARSVRWGIPFPGDPDHVVYVWFEALINYVTAAHFRQDGTPRVPDLWPADLHVIGKDIVRFHAIIWPAMLRAADLPLPKAITTHGYVQVGGAKISKSAGGTVSPVEVARQYGVDALRYFLLREIPWGGDGEFSLERLEERYTSDLANTLGNLLHRTLTMIEKYCGGVVPDRSEYPFERSSAAGVILGVTQFSKVRAHYDEFEFAQALHEIMRIARFLNEQIDRRAPWEMAKDPAQRALLEGFLRGLANYLRQTAILLSPVMPTKAAEMWHQLGLEPDEWADLRIASDLEAAPNAEDLEDLDRQLYLAMQGEISGRSVRKGTPLFPRRDLEKRPRA